MSPPTVGGRLNVVNLDCKKDEALINKYETEVSSGSEACFDALCASVTYITLSTFILYLLSYAAAK